MACQPRQVFTRFALAAAIASVLPTGRGLAQERDRSKIPDKYKWNLADLYPSEEAWRAAKERLLAEIPKLKDFRGHARLVAGATRRRARAADAVEQGARAGPTSTPACCRTRTRASASTRACSRKWRRSNAQLGGEAAFIEPEILKTDRATIDRFVASEPRLKPFRLYLDDIQRRRPHTLDRCGGEAARRPRRSSPRDRRTSTASSRTPTSRTRR